MKILSLAPLAGPGLERLRALGPLELDPWLEHVPIRLHAARDLVERLAGVGALIVEADSVPAEVIERSGSLRMIGVCRGDPVNVDVEAATKAGVPVVRAPARNANAVAELTVGLVIALTRGIVGANDDVRGGRWVVDGRIAQQRYAGREVTTLTVGLVGCGAVGRATGRRLGALGARVLGFDPNVGDPELRDAGIEPVTLDELLERSDVVSLHATLDEDTRGMIDAAAFARMRPGAFLVNTARYDLVDEPAMLDALRTGRLAGAALDHFRNEFLSAEHPLASMSNVILTPHIGGSTRETVEAHTLTVAEGFEALLAGREPRTLVNPEALATFLTDLR